LFDAEGRLIGITTFTRRESQNINLAVPANRIAELPERGRQMLERRTADGATTAPTPSATAPASPLTPAELTEQRRPGDWFEYVITDHHTKVKNSVSLRVDRVTGDRVVFNGGARVEGVDGQVLEANSPALVELDTVTPPGGWAPGGQVMSGAHRLKVSTAWQNQPATYDLTARTSAEHIIRVGTTEYQAVRIDLQGWHRRAQMYAVARDMPYRASVWYAPALRRVVRFNVEFRAGAGVNETLELVRAGRN
jgi:hypothetical protein